ncbi:MAG TPA: hypothetical protein EYG92_00420 [Lutibacter sp.]|nr:hypothetical protein [Lutibacter sp.]
MREDDDWILFGMYGEPLRLRNVNNHALWQEIHTPYYIDQETEATTGIKTQYAELAINDEYLGIYALGEQVDRKQLKLKKFTTNIRGELYKGIGWGNSTFLEIFAYDNLDRVWGGFEMKYPKDDEITDWENLYNLVDFVINSTNESFEENISSRFVLNNAIDYFIFINTIRAADNMGRNLYVAKYKEDEPYFYVPWDFDWSFGMWDFEQQNITNDIMSNGLYDRLLSANSSLFREALVARWFELRNTSTLETTSFITSINERYTMLLANGNYEREILKWGTETIDLDNLNYTTTWIQERFTFLDAYFGNLLKIDNLIQSD